MCIIFDNVSGKRCFADGWRREYVPSQESRRKFNENHELGSPNVPGAALGLANDHHQNPDRPKEPTRLGSPEEPRPALRNQSRPLTDPNPDEPQGGTPHRQPQLLHQFFVQARTLRAELVISLRRCRIKREAIDSLAIACWR